MSCVDVHRLRSYGDTVNGCRESRLRRLWRRVTRRRRRVEPGGWDFPPEAGVREPRRPLPFTGAGTIVLPLDR